MAADPTIQAYIDQIHELQAAAQAAKAELGGGIAKGQAQGQSQTTNGNGSMGHPSEPLSQTVAKQAAINHFVLSLNQNGDGSGGNSQNMGGRPNLQEQIAEQGLNRGGANDVRMKLALAGLNKESDDDITSQMARAMHGATRDQDPLYNGPFANKTRKGQVVGQESYRAGYRPTGPNMISDPLGTYRFTGGGGGTPVANAYTQARMNESQLWGALQGTAKDARMSFGKANSGYIQMYKQLNREYAMDQAKMPWHERDDNPLPTFTAIGKSPIFKLAAKGIGALAAFAYEGYEQGRALQYETYSVGRMTPGLARSQAMMQLEQDRADFKRGTTVHALSAAAFITGVGIPVAMALEGANYAFEKARDLYSKRYTQEIERDSGIADLVRKYGLGDTNRPAEERIKGFKDKFQTAGEFKAQLESALDDLHQGYERIGLGDFGERIDQDGGVAHMKRANDKVNGIAPLWYSPGQIFSMLDSARLARRQFASSNTARAKSRTGD